VTRTALTLVAFAGLSLWATAQDTTSNRVATDIELLRTNRVLLDDLIDHGLQLSKAGGPLDRAVECRKTAATLGLALKHATGGTDDDRVAELSDYLTAVVRDGLVPNFDLARQGIPRGSQDYERLKKEADGAKKDLDALDEVFPTEGKLGRSGKVAEARRKLAEARSKIVVPE